MSVYRACLSERMVSTMNARANDACQDVYDPIPACQGRFRSLMTPTNVIRLVSVLTLVLITVQPLSGQGIPTDAEDVPTEWRLFGAGGWTRWDSGSEDSDTSNVAVVGGASVDFGGKLRWRLVRSYGRGSIRLLTGSMRVFRPWTQEGAPSFYAVVDATPWPIS